MRRETLRKAQASVEQQINRLTEAYLGSVLELAEYQRRRGDLEQRRQALQNQQAQLEAQSVSKKRFIDERARGRAAAA